MESNTLVSLNPLARSRFGPYLLCHFEAEIRKQRNPKVLENERLHSSSSTLADSHYVLFGSLRPSLRRKLATEVGKRVGGRLQQLADAPAENDDSEYITFEDDYKVKNRSSSYLYKPTEAFVGGSARWRRPYGSRVHGKLSLSHFHCAIKRISNISYMVTIAQVVRRQKLTCCLKNPNHNSFKNVKEAPPST